MNSGLNFPLNDKPRALRSPSRVDLTAPLRVIHVVTDDSPGLQPAVEELMNAAWDNPALDALLVLDKPITRQKFVPAANPRCKHLSGWSRAGRAFEFYRLCREHQADAVFVHSQHPNTWCRYASLRAGVKHIFESGYHTGDDAKQLIGHKIPYGISLAPFAKVDEVPLALRIPGIIMPSGFEDDRHQQLIRAVACLREVRLYPRIFLTGPGSQRACENAQQLCNALGLENQVRVARHCSNLPFLLMHHQVAMIANPAQEQILVAQAMAAGCVTLGITQNSDSIIHHAHDGVLFSAESPELLAEELHGLLTNSIRSQGMANHARAKALQEFSLQRMVENYQEIYEGLGVQQSPVEAVA